MYKQAILAKTKWFKTKPFKLFFAFTLAEVLITLGIIGVVAAMTIPTLLNNSNKQEYVTALKKQYSIFSQAYLLLKNQNGGDITMSMTGTTDADDANFLNELAKVLRLQTNCGNAMGCWYTTPMNWLNGTLYRANFDSTNSGHYAKAVLSDGSVILIDIWDASCSSTVGTSALKFCGGIDIDVNGAKGPNAKGRDIFYFWITKTGIYPFGSTGDGYSCDATTAVEATNRGCAFKVLTEGAENY